MIATVVRKHYGELRRCYESGIERDATLAGNVMIRFRIERGGAVSGVSTEGSELPDLLVIECIARVFGTIRFPAPNPRTIRVVYPINFEPG